MVEISIRVLFVYLYNFEILGFLTTTRNAVNLSRYLYI